MINKLKYTSDYLLNYNNNVNNIDNYIKSLILELKEKNYYLYMYQITTSILLDDKIYRYRNIDKKKQYMDMSEYEIISKLDEKIRKEWTWFFANDSLKYSKEFNELLNKNEKKLKQELWKEFNYDIPYEKTMDYYREKMIKELNIKNEQLKEWKKLRNKVEWKRKFEFPINNWDIFSFDYRNSVTTIFAIWNHIDWINIIWVGWWWSSYQRQVFSELIYVFFNILEEDKKNRIKDFNTNILETNLLYYNKFNKLEDITTLHNKFFINYDIWSNSNIYDNNNLREKIFKEMNTINISFWFNENSIYSWRNFDFDININQLNKEWVIYVENNEDKIYIYFWDIDNCYWDDWNDTPTILNSWSPYIEFVNSIISYKIPNNDYYIDDYYSNNLDNYNMDKIKEKKMRLFSDIKYGDSFSTVIEKMKDYWKPYKEF